MYLSMSRVEAPIRMSVYVFRVLCVADSTITSQSGSLDGKAISSSLEYGFVTWRQCVGI
jgi:hypothetical protein